MKFPRCSTLMQLKTDLIQGCACISKPVFIIAVEALSYLSRPDLWLLLFHSTLFESISSTTPQANISFLITLLKVLIYSPFLHIGRQNQIKSNLWFTVLKQNAHETNDPGGPDLIDLCKHYASNVPQTYNVLWTNKSSIIIF